MTFDTTHQAFKDAKERSEQEIADALAAMQAEFVKVKEDYFADRTPEKLERKKEVSLAFQEARKAARANRPEGHQIGGDFRGFQADAFKPDDQGGNTALALQLLEGLFAQRGDTTSDPATVLAEMRAGIS